MKILMIAAAVLLCATSANAANHRHTSAVCTAWGTCNLPDCTPVPSAPFPGMVVLGGYKVFLDAWGTDAAWRCSQQRAR